MSVPFADLTSWNLRPVLIVFSAPCRPSGSNSDTVSGEEKRVWLAPGAWWRSITLIGTAEPFFEELVLHLVRKFVLGNGDCVAPIVLCVHLIIARNLIACTIVDLDLCRETIIVTGLADMSITGSRNVRWRWWLFRLGLASTLAIFACLLLVILAREEPAVVGTGARLLLAFAMAIRAGSILAILALKISASIGGRAYAWIVGDLANTHTLLALGRPHAS